MLDASSYSEDELLLWLVSQIPRKLFEECCSIEEKKTQTHTYADLALLLTEIALKREQDKYMDTLYNSTFKKRGGGGTQLAKDRLGMCLACD